MKKYQTWHRQQLFDPSTIKKTTTISLKNRLRLLFTRRRYAAEENTIIAYKQLDGVTYVLKVQHYDD